MDDAQMWAEAKETEDAIAERLKKYPAAMRATILDVLSLRVNKMGDAARMESEGGHE